MAKLSAIYASALFDLAVESGRSEEYLAQSVLMRDTLADVDCLRILVHPHISTAEKQEFFGRAFHGHLNSDLSGLLNLVIEKNREAYLLPALGELIKLIERHHKKTTATVLSAAELDETQVAEIKKLLSGKLDKDVSVALKIDPSAIGGQFIHVDGYYLDRTLKSQLRDMTDHVKDSK